MLFQNKLNNFADYSVRFQTVNISIPTFNVTVVAVINQWIVVQQRLDQTTHFNRPWSAYKSGFGNSSGNYWMGLGKLYQLTNIGSYMVRFEMLLVTGSWLSAEYDTFRIENEAMNYTNHVTGYSGDAGDIMNAQGIGGHTVVNGMQFSTTDNGKNTWCASTECGGWWYNNHCDWFNLNADTAIGFCLCASPACRTCTGFSITRIMIKLA